MNTKIEERQGGRIATAMRVVNGALAEFPVMNIIRKDKLIPEKRRGRACYAIPTFCPFCGSRYETGACDD
ncbi:hypothetical protein [Acetobacter fallax]|nr:hypothetical protein [Acetobacter fallax]